MRFTICPRTSVQLSLDVYLRNTLNFPSFLDFMAPKMAGRKTWGKSGNWAPGTGAFHQTETQASNSERQRGKEDIVCCGPRPRVYQVSLATELGRYRVSILWRLGSAASLSPKRPLEYILKAGSTEWCNRLGYALSLGGRTVQHGAKHKVRYTCKNDRVDESARKKTFQSFGFDEMMRMFNCPEGQALR